MLHVRTNNQKRQIEDGENGTNGFTYKKYFYNFADFILTETGSELHKAGWYGLQPATMGSGVCVKFPDDEPQGSCENIIVGWFWYTSKVMDEMEKEGVL